MYDYVHLPAEEDIDPQGRTYRAFEAVLAYQDRQVLFLEVESSGVGFCCGTYADHVSGINVKGYIVNWKYKETEHGEPISCIEPVASQTEQGEIREILLAEYPTLQVTFRE